MNPWPTPNAADPVLAALFLVLLAWVARLLSKDQEGGRK